MTDIEKINFVVSDFQKRKLYGTVEFGFREGRLTFIGRKETYLFHFPESERNSPGPRRSNGTDDSIATGI
jgi:hypothetical protein